MLSPYTQDAIANIRIFKKCFNSIYNSDNTNKSICKRNKFSIYKRYLLYDVSYNTTSPIAPIPSMRLIKDPLISLYDKKPSDFEAIYSHTISLNNSICAYCLIRPANEVDHFLPKNEYPEYSLFAKNLLPICSKCNKNRKQKFSTFYNGNIRKNFNLYFDDFVKRMFTYNINYIEGLPFISVEINDSTTLNVIQANIIKEHFKHIGSLTKSTLKLEYAEKIELFFKEVVSSHISEMYKKDTFEEFKRYIESKILLKLEYLYDFLWFNKSFIHGDVNMDGFYMFLENIYTNLSNLDSLYLERWLLDSLNSQ